MFITFSCLNLVCTAPPPPSPPPLIAGSPPLSVALDELPCGENCLEVEAILDETSVANLTLCNSEFVLVVVFGVNIVYFVG